MSKEQAKRYNAGKPELSYVLDVMPALKDMVAVMEFGAEKYDRNNWQKGFPREKLLDSLLRHIDAFHSGEDIDPESGLPHVGHILCNAAFLGYHYGSHSEYWKNEVVETKPVMEFVERLPQDIHNELTQSIRDLRNEFNEAIKSKRSTGTSKTEE